MTSQNSLEARQDRTLEAWRDNAEVFEYLPPKIIERIKEVDPYWYGLDESQLHREVNPTQVDIAVRLNFWSCIVKSRKSGDRINVKRDVLGDGVVCSVNYFWNYFLKNDKKLAWMMRPIADYKKSLAYMQEVMVWRMNEIAMLPFKNKKGETDHRAVNSFLKAYEIIDNRLNGMAHQSVAIQQSGSVQHDHTARIEKADPERLACMKQKIEELEAAKKPEVIDATITAAKRVSSTE